jgi:hypothetical protein
MASLSHRVNNGTFHTWLAPPPISKDFDCILTFYSYSMLDMQISYKVPLNFGCPMVILSINFGELEGINSGVFYCMT